MQSIFKILLACQMKNYLKCSYLKSSMQYIMDYENTKYMYHLPAETAEDTYFGAVSMHFENDTGELGWIISHFLAHCDTENIASYKVVEKSNEDIGGKLK